MMTSGAAATSDWIGGVLAIGFVIACLALRGWLLSPSRRFWRLRLSRSPEPVVRELPTESAASRSDAAHMRSSAVGLPWAGRMSGAGPARGTPSAVIQGWVSADVHHSRVLGRLERHS
jgi:hypothetical protein